MRVPKNRKPPHPGRILRKYFLDNLGIDQQQLANAIGVEYKRIKSIVNERRDISEDTALRLAKYFGNTPGFWLNLQSVYNLYKVEQKINEDLNKITALEIENDCVSISEMNLTVDANQT
ncbi:HigA family addiction module antitoxin [Gloeocapsopsis dulcis]|uniref:Addiction module antidote protein, HigA family n=1 Tax=Gloeocapsopsis dulcis AAB1 = 1H9 TaxID=1433147 RepID=A0A6N8G1E7_9CHRO|nr:HigA family addiction module antitoxin [Gloeocapsopsis dulcis]MUL38197.1 addiction module antidote protein, HigA family [Gloeocapsopsis dulcis AAB1 = 1H9]WNN90771.1 HigA family addiction module antitoxin [Gloeocapsopsis dulcis]